MIFLVHEKAPVIDPSLETTISDSRMILTKFADLLLDQNQHQIVRAPEKVLQMIDGITPMVTYVEGFDSEEYIPKAMSLNLKCPIVNYEELLMILNGRKERSEVQLENLERAVEDADRRYEVNDEPAL